MSREGVDLELTRTHPKEASPSSGYATKNVWHWNGPIRRLEKRGDLTLCYETIDYPNFKRSLPKYCDAAAATEAATGATTEAVYFYEKRGRFWFFYARVKKKDVPSLLLGKRVEKKIKYAENRAFSDPNISSDASTPSVPARTGERTRTTGFYIFLARGSVLLWILVSITRNELCSIGSKLESAK